MCQLDQATEHPDVWSNIILALSVKSFWMRLTFELVDEGLMWVGLSQSVEDLNRTKRLTLLGARGENSAYLLPSYRKNGSSWVLSLPSFRLKCTPLMLLILRPLDSDWNSTTISPQSPACCQPPWLYEPIPYSKSIYLSSWFLVSGEL